MNSTAIWRLRSACACLLLIVVSTTALAQRNPTVTLGQVAEQRVALVIGNSAYKESPLANPVNDATDIAKALQDMGFKVILKRNSNTREMRQAIREFGTELRRAHVGLFYFAGHGIQVKGNNYLLPVEADIQGEADAEDLAIDANYALRTMEESQATVSIVILDACRNNPFARSFRSASRGLAQMTAATGSLIAFATAPGSVTADGTGRNGIYTKHLLASLSQPDTDILKVFQRARAAVVKETGGRQTPWEFTSLIGDFYFRPSQGTQEAAPVALPAAPAVPTGGQYSLDDLKRQQESRAQWGSWQVQMKAAFDQTATLVLAPDLQAAAWERFLSSYAQDNPYSAEDEELRAEAQKRKQVAEAESARQKADTERRRMDAARHNAGIPTQPFGGIQGAPTWQRVQPQRAQPPRPPPPPGPPPGPPGLPAVPPAPLPPGS